MSVLDVEITGYVEIFRQRLYGGIVFLGCVRQLAKFLAEYLTTYLTMFSIDPQDSRSFTRTGLIS